MSYLLRFFFYIFILCIFLPSVYAQEESPISAKEKIILHNAKFMIGNNDSWKQKSFDDSAWKILKTDIPWENQGYSGYDGIAWYRIHFKLPSSFLATPQGTDFILFNLSKIDDADETYLNGILIGGTKRHSVERKYKLPITDPALHWDQDNVLAIKVTDWANNGGFYVNSPYIQVLNSVEEIKIEETRTDDGYAVKTTNTNTTSIDGTLTIKILDAIAEKEIVLKEISDKLTLASQQKVVTKISVPFKKPIRLSVTFSEKNTGNSKSLSTAMPYILTPKTAEKPRINGAEVLGVRPNSPILFKIPVTGKKPLQYKINRLPEGLTLDTTNGIISGSLSQTGDYTMKIIVTNNKGKTERDFTVKIGDLIALTPPMGWSSWNCWGLSVSEEKVRRSAEALINKDLINHGWTYINVDDGWQSEKRTEDGKLLPNKKFPDMKSLGHWLHSQGLKFGIYSSPGSYTCGRRLGSYLHEKQDMDMFASWNIDYLKYDWCGYDDILVQEKDYSTLAYMKPYQVMEKEIKAQKRDIVYSLCQYGLKEVWKWGADVDGNNWRTTNDGHDSWESLRDIGFKQYKYSSYAKPGRWNDPDMLTIGLVGWGENLHPTGLTPDEQYTQISLWSLLASPLMLGCDIEQMDDFTLSLVSNDEVIGVNQDPLGKQAELIFEDGDLQIWVKSMKDGSYAIGIFNLGEGDQTFEIDWTKLGLPKASQIRDLWRQKNLRDSGNIFKTRVASHGVRLINLR